MNVRIFIVSIFVILNNIQINNGQKNIENVRIVIVGAGSSGIAAASKLLQNGFKNVIILEAEDRIGGRTFTTKFGDYNVDVGGQWVQGENGNVAFDLAYPLDLLEKSDEPNSGLTQIFFESSGEQVNDIIGDNIIDFFWRTYGNKPDNDSVYKSMGDYMEKKFDQEFKNVPEIFNEKSKYLNYLELAVTSDISAESWNDIDVSYNLQFREDIGDIMISWKDRGYSTILDILMKRYPNPEQELPILNNTILNSEVALINYQSPSIVVTTTRGQVYSANHVIVTVPLGVLKEKYETLFNPTLPDYKIKTIKALGYGSIAKIYFLFDKPFWQLNGRRILLYTFIWNDEDRKIMENDPEKSWLLGVIGFNTVQYKPNLIEFWVGEKYAKTMESLPEDKVFKYSVEIIHRFFDKTFNVTEPIAMLRSQWFTNPHFRGTYSYVSVEATKKNISNSMLEQPVNLDNLAILFAGEATSSDRFSVVDGAIASGWKAANRLIDFYKN